MILSKLKHSAYFESSSQKKKTVVWKGKMKSLEFVDFNKTFLPKTSLIFRIPFIDDSTTPFNEIFTVIATILGLLTTFIVTTIDSIFLIVSLNLKTHFEILQNQLKACGFSDGKELRSLIIYHKKLLELADNLNENFETVILGQIVFQSAKIGLLVLQILNNSTRTEDMHNFRAVPNCCFLGAAIVQITICIVMVETESQVKVSMWVLRFRNLLGTT